MSAARFRSFFKWGTLALFSGFVAMQVWLSLDRTQARAVDEHMQAQMRDPEHLRKVEDAMASYEIAAREGSAIERCIQAGRVRQLLPPADLRGKFAHWEGLEQSACAAAGLRR